MDVETGRPQPLVGLRVAARPRERHATTDARPRFFHLHRQAVQFGELVEQRRGGEKVLGLAGTHLDGRPGVEAEIVSAELDPRGIGNQRQRIAFGNGSGGSDGSHREQAAKQQRQQNSEFHLFVRFG